MPVEIDVGGQVLPVGPDVDAAPEQGVTDMIAVLGHERYGIPAEALEV